MAVFVEAMAKNCSGAGVALVTILKGEFYSATKQSDGSWELTKFAKKREHVMGNEYRSVDDTSKPGSKIRICGADVVLVEEIQV